ncbi:hypothetical protein VKT23_006909 [Stygiomarasmius scandens]|uniref:Uncharacterized protein n=1 Tax=Marasmiellus scandens TaxID=2682957 RepID=A0ABR1JP16_9AGAR
MYHSDLITILVVKSTPEDPPAIWLLIDTACNGLLGGSATIYALLRAYAVDFSLPGQWLSAYIWIVLLVVQVIGTLVTVPALTIYYHITPSLRANQLLATMIGLLATVSDLLAFIPSLHERMFMLFGIFIPAFIVNNLMPLLFTIGTMYFDAVGRSQEIGFLLSAMAGLQNFGGVLSYYIFLAIMEDPSTGPKSAFLLTPGLLAFTTLSLFLLRGWKTPNPHALVEPPEETSSLPTPAEENTTNSSNISV